MANGFTVQPANFGGGLSALAGSVGEFRTNQAEQQKAQKQAEYAERAKQAMAEAFQSGDPAAIRNAVIQYPEIGETAKQMFGFTNDQTEQVARNTYRQALSTKDPQRRAAIMQQGIQDVQRFGGQPTNMMADLQMLQEDPEDFERSARAGYAALASDQEYDAMFGAEQGGPKIGTYNPRDYTTQSFAEFTKTGDPSVLERYASQRSVDIGGVPHVFDPARGGYYPASVSGEGRQQPVTSRDVAESEAEITRGRETAKQDVKSQSPEERRKVESQIKEIRNNIASSQDVISRLDSIARNPGHIESITGVRGKLPAIPGTEGFDAEIAFDQLRDTLTLGNLDKMSGVLSESDIKILSSAASGLEYGMSEEALTERMDDIRSVFESKSQQERAKLTEIMQGMEGVDSQPQISEEEADAFINQMLEQ